MNRFLPLWEVFLLQQVDSSIPPGSELGRERGCWACSRVLPALRLMACCSLHS